MKVLGIIPARGGSKRVPKKNIKILAGKPLIGYTIDAANKSLKLADCIVSTDSNEISNIAKELGGNVPFIRPAELAQDASGDRPVLIHAINWYQNNVNSDIEAICILRPTSPFRTGQMIDDAIQALIDSKADSIRSMTKVEGVHHPYWMYKNENDLAKEAVEGVSVEQYYQSQLLPPIYRLNGAVDVILVKHLLNENSTLYGKMKIHEIGEKESLDIDTISDFEYCEWLMSKKT